LKVFKELKYMPKKKIKKITYEQNGNTRDTENPQETKRKFIEMKNSLEGFKGRFEQEGKKKQT
jgi:hypothetical protein